MGEYQLLDPQTRGPDQLQKGRQKVSKIRGLLLAIEKRGFPMDWSTCQVGHSFALCYT